MTNQNFEELLSLTNGKNAWETNAAPSLDVRPFRVCDGSAGLRYEEKDANGKITTLPSTCFPCEATLACSFDRNLVHDVASAIAQEAACRGVDILLAPGVSVKRNPLCGRNFEYFSEDPHLTGELATAFVTGVQENGVGATVKHFALNEQETARVSSDSIADERAKREIYFAPFETVIQKSDPYMVMSSYNKVDGEYTAQNRRLLTNVLRDEWQYDGLIISDWGGTKDPVSSINAGLDTAMPGGGTYYIREATRAFKKGKIAVERLKQIGERYRTLSVKLGAVKQQQFEEEAHNTLAREAAEQSAVLLKNDGRLLPIETTKKVAIIGEAAKTPHYQGGGASNVVPTKVTSVLDCVGNFAEFTYAKDGEDALQCAQKSDVAIVFVAYGFAGESEGYDREDLSLPPEQNDLIESTIAANPNTVVVIMSGRAVEMPWISKAKAVLFLGMAGQNSGEAVCNLLFGKVSPSGKLSETFPLKWADVSSRNHFGDEHLVLYRESIFVGYRYYDSAGKDVLFPFGHGLSYSAFEYSGLEIKDRTVCCSIKNTGLFTAAEVAQLYIRSPKTTVFMPDRQLRGFEKVTLAPGEQKSIVFELSERDFAYYNTRIQNWHVQGGTYDILIGSSSHDIRLEGEISMPDDRPNAPIPDYRVAAPEYYNPSEIQNVTDESFAAILGRNLPRYSTFPYHDESTLKELKDTWIGRSINKLVDKNLAGGGISEQAGGYSQRYMLSRIAPYLPLFSLTIATDGKIGKKGIRFLLFLLNTFSAGGKKHEEKHGV
ncbi:MAG: glycoside hydrolase family 3 C-terminal domain-containing protein [Clostridiales Family XIII bacterium]|jgi:beta-glucosidase|nr:glycoside hydrolase family 3 C-terminal domain-containing protein [Clostridiales Family XIII bacterium]